MSKKQDDSTNENTTTKEDNPMVAKPALKIDNIIFDDFLKSNKDLINTIVPRNPSISKDDEWRQETEWDAEGNNN